MQLIEPQRWVNVIQAMNTFVSSSQLMFTIVSILADVIVFLFPVFLAGVYIVWMKKKSDVYKVYALRIFSSAIIAAIINIIIQFFFNKTRPESVLTATWSLLLKHLPTMSFPSDHAAVSMAFAIATYYFSRLLQLERAKNTMRWWAIFFVIWSIVMSLARVAVWVHRPTDILAGWVVWILAVIISRYIPTGIYNWIISLEKKIMWIFVDS
jgi:membrane-associated phospholipid phosphatase